MPTFRAVRMALYMIEVPIGKASDTEQLWSYVNEEAVGLQTQVALSLNGLRVGLGRGQDWPEIQRILQRLTGRQLQQAAAQVLPGESSAITLKRSETARTLFLYRPDRTLSGDTVAAGEYLLNVTAGIDPNNLAQVLITGLPQLRTEGQRLVVHNATEVRWEFGPFYDSFMMALFQLSVPQESFLVIGPGSQAARQTSLGHALLINSRNGMPFETVLVLVPELFSAAAPAR